MRRSTEVEKSFEFCTEKFISISNGGRQPEASRVRARVGGKETAQCQCNNAFQLPSTANRPRFDILFMSRTK